MEPQGSLGTEGEQRVLVPSPRSEAVTHDMEELSLQPSQSLPPIKERKNVLQLRLQQRRTREQLVDQGIFPSLKTPVAFHEQIRSLERARTENFLKHKIGSRPERAELVRMHILQETQAEPSLQATQLKLKRARLADDLNEKIAQRPGPMELVEKNILPVDSSVKEAIIEGEVNYQKTLDVYNFDEDSSEALSPENPASQESQCSVPSPREAKLPDISSASQSPGSNLCPPTTQSAEFFSRTSAEDQANARLTAAPQPAITAAPTKPGPTLLKQSQPKLPSEKSRSKKSKEPKPRVRKLKYHQYIPPDQKQEPNEAPMDSAYARLLQQQQQFLHLQILSQQQQHYNYQAILPAPLRPVAEAQSSCPNVALGNSQALPAPIVVSMPSAAPARPHHAMNNRKPGPLPANLDEMKVAELKMELKLRGLPVSGTKTDLIERLKPYQESSAATSPKPAPAMDTIAPPASQQPDSMSTTPPVSPAQSELSTAPMEEAVGGSSAKATAAPPPAQPAGGSSPLKTEDMETKVSDKDQRLHEKERQIEELIRKLEQEQRLVEELKMQLEVEKRSQQGAAAQQNDPSPPAHVKEERDASPSCGSMHGPMPVSPAGLKQEESQAQVHTAPMQQFYVSSPQQLPQTSLIAQPGPHILLPTTIHLTNKSTTPQVTAPTGPTHLIKVSQNVLFSLTQTSLQCFCSQTMPLCSSSGFQPGQSMSEVPQCFISNSQESCSPRVSPRHSAMNGLTKPPSTCQPTYILSPSTFTNHHSSKSKDPPRYEEAVKQTRALQATLQVPNATSQHMDDLFDVLIESGEISPLITQDPLSVDKLLPVTASITTLPINTALSRPPPQVQVAHPPEPPPSLVALATDHQLEALLEGTLSADAEPRTLRLMEELHSHLLERPHSPMDTDELAFSDSPPPSLHLHDTNLDNMEWLDLTAPGPTGISASTGVFSSDFLDSHDLNWD
uniref:SAP domain-containing protein n=1 Tax=Pygocentrus nattereri TaxID=42514 RepID=A0A3B4C4M5_PYGNA